MNPQDIIAELNGVLARAELERMAALEHLFSIVDGPDRDMAINTARLWLKEKYGDAYDMLSAVCQRVRQTADGVEWPEELET